MNLAPHLPRLYLSATNGDGRERIGRSDVYEKWCVFEMGKEREGATPRAALGSDAFMIMRYEGWGRGKWASQRMISCVYSDLCVHACVGLCDFSFSTLGLHGWCWCTERYLCSQGSYLI